MYDFDEEQFYFYDQFYGLRLDSMFLMSKMNYLITRGSCRIDMNSTELLKIIKLKIE